MRFFSPRKPELVPSITNVSNFQAIDKESFEKMIAAMGRMTTAINDNTKAITKSNTNATRLGRKP